jgi:hypothetical protein
VKTAKLSQHAKFKVNKVPETESSPETFHKTASHAIDRLTQPIVVPATLSGVGLAGIWLFRYYRRTRKKAVHS